MQRYHEERRFLDRELDGVDALRRIITRGELRNNDDGCGCFVLDWHGVYYYLVVGYHEKDYRVVVSGWPMVREREQALDSGRWLSEELNTIDQFNEDHFNERLTDDYTDYVAWSKAH